MRRQGVSVREPEQAYQQSVVVDSFVQLQRLRLCPLKSLSQRRPRRPYPRKQ